MNEMNGALYLVWLVDLINDLVNCSMNYLMRADPFSYQCDGDGFQCRYYCYCCYYFWLS